MLEICGLLDVWACKIYGLPEFEGQTFLAEEVCPLPLSYPPRGVSDSAQADLSSRSISQLVKDVCETHGYRRAFTKKGYWANRRLELSCHLLKVNPLSLTKVSTGDVTRHLATPFADLISYGVGVMFGRWDIRIATGEAKAAPGPDAFSLIRPWSPGMLVRDDSKSPSQVPSGYPINIISHGGLVVDDPDHPDDIVRRLRNVIECIWPDRAENVESEISKGVGATGLREYLRSTVGDGFWPHHHSRYSKSRRKAPIYWLLQSSKKNYALWLYYHRLDKDLLFKALVNYVEPKIRLETSRLETLRSQKAAAGESGKEAKRLAKEVERQEDFLSELRDFEDKLRRAANLHLEPDLNDGVVLNIAPLQELVPWKEAKNYWDELLEGKYEWSSIGKQLRQKGLVK